MKISILSRSDNDQFFYDLLTESVKLIPENSLVYYVWAEPLIKLELMLSKLDFNCSNVYLFIPDDLTTRDFVPVDDKLTYGSKILSKIFTAHPSTNFTLVTQVNHLINELHDINNLKIIECDFITIKNKKYLQLAGETNKNMNSNFSFLMLNGRASTGRVIAVSYLLYKDIFKFNITSPTNGFLNYTNQFNDFLSLCNWPLDIPDSVNEGFKLIKNIKYNNVSEYRGLHLDTPGNFDKHLRQLYHQVFVEIVAETYYEEPSFMVTEKTLHSIYGCVFPLFISSKGYVKHLEDLGFDMFHDILDHRYDDIDNPIERIITLIECNKKILTDLAYTKDVWLKNKHRFGQNLKFAKETMYDKIKIRALNQFN